MWFWSIKGPQVCATEVVSVLLWIVVGKTQAEFTYYSTFLEYPIQKFEWMCSLQTPLYSIVKVKLVKDLYISIGFLWHSTQRLKYTNRKSVSRSVTQMLTSDCNTSWKPTGDQTQLDEYDISEPKSTGWKPGFTYRVQQ